jgi:hypothetical protein
VGQVTHSRELDMFLKYEAGIASEYCDQSRETVSERASFETAVSDCGENFPMMVAEDVAEAVYRMEYEAIFNDYKDVIFQP